MLDEGLNEYWDHRQIVAANDRATAQTWLTKLVGVDVALGEFEQQRLGAMLSDPADPVGNSSWDRMSSNSYGTVYARTATVMHDLEQQVGKEALERAFKQYYAAWKFRHPSIADFRESMAEGTGQRALVEKVFAEQVYNVRKVDDRIAEFESDEILPQPGLVEVKGQVVERKPSEIDKSVEDARTAWTKAHPKAKKGEGPFEYATRIVVRRAGAVVPQNVLVRFADGTSQTLRLPGNGDKRWARWRLVTKSQAVSVEIDPERRVFLDKDKIDDSRTLEADGSAARRWSADIAAFFQSLLALLVTA
jgi:hypothetical protein